VLSPEFLEGAKQGLGAIRKGVQEVEDGLNNNDPLMTSRAIARLTGQVAVTCTLILSRFAIEASDAEAGL
jgi:hypothetical protein